MGQCYSKALVPEPEVAASSNVALGRGNSCNKTAGPQSENHLQPKRSAHLVTDEDVSGVSDHIRTSSEKAGPDAAIMHLTPQLLATGCHAVCLIMDKSGNHPSLSGGHEIAKEDKLRLIVAWANPGCLKNVKAKSLEAYSGFLQELMSTDNTLVSHLKQVAEMTGAGAQVLGTPPLRVVVVYGPAEAGLDSVQCAMHALALRPCTWEFNGKPFAGIAIEHIPTHAPPRILEALPTNKLAVDSLTTSPVTALQPMALRLARLLAAVDSSPIMMTVCTLDGRVMYQNASSVGYAGYWATAAERNFFQEFLTEQPELQDELMGAITTDEPWSRVVKVPNSLSKGSQILAEVVKMPQSMVGTDRRRCSIDFKATSPSTVSKGAWVRWRGDCQAPSSLARSVSSSRESHLVSAGSNIDAAKLPLGNPPSMPSIRKRASSSWLAQALEGHDTNQSGGHALMGTTVGSQCAQEGAATLDTLDIMLDAMDGSQEPAMLARSISKHASVHATESRLRADNTFGSDAAMSGHTHSAGPSTSGANAASGSSSKDLGPKPARTIGRSRTLSSLHVGDAVPHVGPPSMAPTRQRLMSLMEAAALNSHTNMSHATEQPGACYVSLREATTGQQSSWSVQDLFDEEAEAGISVPSPRTDQLSRFAGQRSPSLTTPKLQPFGHQDAQLLLSGAESAVQDAKTKQQELPSFTWHEVHVIPFIDPETATQVVLVAQMDVTERSELEQRLVQLTEAQLYMLENMFPRHILERLACMVGAQSDGVPQNTMLGLLKELSQSASHHDCVTIMFADIVGFTSMAKEVQPEQVMSFLNELFSLFDELVNHHKVYKVETAGDCYIVCAGLLDQDEDGFKTLTVDNQKNSRHTAASRQRAARRVLNFTVDMMYVAKTVLMPNNGQPVQQRAGVHSGPVVSGLIGQLLPKFALFGDTMNTASRMESTSIVGRIQVSEATHELLNDKTDRWECSGGVEVKGKGMMNTYLLAEQAMHSNKTAHNFNMYETTMSHDFARTSTHPSSPYSSCGLPPPVYDTPEDPRQGPSTWNTNLLCSSLMRSFSTNHRMNFIQSTASISLPSPPGPCSQTSLDIQRSREHQAVGSGSKMSHSRGGSSNMSAVVQDSPTGEILPSPTTTSSARGSSCLYTRAGPSPSGIAARVLEGIHNATAGKPAGKPAGKLANLGLFQPASLSSKMPASDPDTRGLGSFTKASPAQGSSAPLTSISRSSGPSIVPVSRGPACPGSLLSKQPGLPEGGPEALVDHNKASPRTSISCEVDSLQTLLQTRDTPPHPALPEFLDTESAGGAPSETGDETVVSSAALMRSRPTYDDRDMPLRLRLAYSSLGKANKTRSSSQDG